MEQFQCIQGIFKEELKNRFLSLVTVDNEDILCYIPSSCRLSNFIKMEGRKVMLRPIVSSSARTKYSVYAIHVGRRYIPINLSEINVLVYEQLHSRRFSFLGKRKSITRETYIENYKSDLFIEDTKTVIEIKGILSLEKTALFPTVYSERAISQLLQISNLLDKGYSVCYMFISLNPTVNTINLNSEVGQYRDAFLSCVKKGMMVCSYSVVLNGSKMEIAKPVKIAIEG